MNKFLAVILLGVLIFIQCKSDSSTPSQKSMLAELEATLASEPSPANANNVVKEINKLIANEDSAEAKAGLIAKGLKISKEHKLSSKRASFITMNLRNQTNGADKKESIIELADLMMANRRDKTANVLYQSIVDLYPDDTRSAAYAEKVKPVTDGDVHAYLLKSAESIFEKPDEYGINRKNSSEYVNACEAYALAYNDEKAPEYLYKAAEIARSLRTFPKTLSLYDWIIDSYPAYEKTPTALFLKGFVIENELKNEELARTTYESFIAKYPEHDLADDVSFLLENLGKSNEEILELIEKNKQQNQAAK